MSRPFNPDPKPEARVRDPAVGLAELLMAKRCPCCGARFKGWPGRSRHHLVGKGQGGDDVLENLVVLCGSGTTGCHGALTSHSRGWELLAGQLRHHLEVERPECIAYILAKKGADWLDVKYPRGLSDARKISGEDQR